MINNIFLIDDDEDDLFMFKEVIESISSSLLCETALNGKIALEVLKNRTSFPDIIFLDLNMPIMDGLDFLIQIKKEEFLKNIPVCIFTTTNTPRDKELTKELGAISFLTKPSDFQMLRSQLEQILYADLSTHEYISIA
ncbi:MAG: response regulator [Ferruginibacter sp.]